MPEREVKIEEVMPLLQERLSAGQRVRFAPMGTSMLPLLRPGRDSVTLIGLDRPPERFDIVMYRRADGSYVLHRVVRAGSPCICLGDHQFECETVNLGQIFAKVISFTRAGREYSVKDGAYRCYCCVWHFTRPVRRLWRGVCVRLRRRFT